MPKHQAKKQKRLKWRYKHPIIFHTITTCSILGALALAGGGYYVAKTVQKVPTITAEELKSDASSNMYSANNQLIWSSAKNKRIYVKFKDIPKSYINLLLATEDHSFYQDQGFSPKGLANAGFSVIQKAFGKGEVRGGSSIEQQLIKLSVFSTSAKDRTIERKIKEIVLAQQLYQNYGKNKILEFYINKIAEGNGAYGAQTISKLYFNKTLDQLSLAQQATIAGLGQAPSVYNLYTNKTAVQHRRDTVLHTAYVQGAITKAQLKTAYAEPIDKDLMPQNWENNEINKVVLANDAFVQSALAQVKSLGYNLDKTPLQIKTTLDLSLNAQVKQLMDNKKYYQTDSQQGATTIMDPRTGYVIAQFGGRHQTQPYSLNRATNKLRSSGSGIKPFIDYGPAIEYFNWPTNKVLDGSDYVYPGTQVTAHNYAHAKYGNVTMQNALRQSINTPAIRTLNAVGSTRAKQFLKNVGIDVTKAPAGSDALGIDVSTAQMANAFATLGTQGVYHPIQYITQLTFSDNSVKKIEFKAKRTIKQSTAFVLTSMLEGVVSDKGTMSNGAIKGVTQAVKTGTVGYPDGANVPPLSSMDIWSNGTTKSRSVSIWMGYDNPFAKDSYIDDTKVMTQKGTLYHDLMQLVSKNQDNSAWVQPNTVRKLSGKGLDAQYVSLDKIKDLSLAPIVSNLNKENADDQREYFVKNASDTKIKVKGADLTGEKLPKDYRPASWKTDARKKRDEIQTKIDADTDFTIASDSDDSSSEKSSNTDVSPTTEVQP